MITLEYDNSPMESDLRAATREALEDQKCPEGRNSAHDCAKCTYSEDYHCVRGRCVRRW